MKQTDEKEFFERGKQIAKWADNNMAKDKALKMAIKALSQDEGWFEPEEAIKACKEALALSEKQHTFPDKKQPTQEPVAWMNDIAFSMDKDELTADKFGDIVPLYTHPAPSWQGLSDDEICRIYGEVQDNCVKDFPSELYAAWFKNTKEKNAVI